MIDVLSLFDQPVDAQAVVAPSPGVFRHSNPQTSKDAAERIGIKVGALKHRILSRLAEVGPANDYTLWQECDRRGRTHSAATRRKALMDAGLVAPAGYRAPTDGDEGEVHQITPAGRVVLDELNRRAA